MNSIERPHDIIDDIRGDFGESFNDLPKLDYYEGIEYLEEFEDVLADFLIKLIDKLYELIDDKFVTREVIDDFIEPMNDEEKVVTFIWLLEAISPFPIYYYAYDIILEDLMYYWYDQDSNDIVIDRSNYPDLVLKPADFEIAQIHIGLEKISDANDNIAFLLTKKRRYKEYINYRKKRRGGLYSLFNTDRFSSTFKAYSEYIKYIDEYIEDLKQEEKLISKNKIEVNGLTNLLFIDKSIHEVVLKFLMKDEIIEESHFQELEYFFRMGKTKSNEKIYFKKKAKKLAFCFFQLAFKYPLINNLEEPRKRLNESEIANIISECFTVKEAVNGLLNVNTLVTYLKKGESETPLNPIFIIEKNKCGEYTIIQPDIRGKRY